MVIPAQAMHTSLPTFNHAMGRGGDTSVAAQPLLQTPLRPRVLCGLLSVSQAQGAEGQPQPCQ